MQTEQNKTFTQLCNLSLFYERCRIPYLTKFFDLLSYAGISFKYKSQAKPNQIIALGFFLQNIKGITKTMTLKQLCEHIKVSNHDYDEFKQNTHLFELIFNVNCEAKETFKAIYVSNQLLMEIESKNEFSLNDLKSKIEDLFSTEDFENGLVTLDYLMLELTNIQNELKGFLFSFHTYLQRALKSNVNIISSSITNNTHAVINGLALVKGKCYSQCDKLRLKLNPYNMINILSSYMEMYTANIDLCQTVGDMRDYMNNGVCAAYSYGSNVLTIPIDEWKNMIIQPFNSMKVIMLEKVVKMKTDLSDMSEQTQSKIIEMSQNAIDEIKEKYGDLCAWITVKGNEIIVVIENTFAYVNPQWLFEYIEMIKQLDYAEGIIKSKDIICSYYQQWLNGDCGKNQIQRSIDFELTWSHIPFITK